jgi:hypothetical protein
VPDEHGRSKTWPIRVLPEDEPEGELPICPDCGERHAPHGERLEEVLQAAQRGEEAFAPGVLTWKVDLAQVATIALALKVLQHERPDLTESVNRVAQNLRESVSEGIAAGDLPSRPIPPEAQA